MPANAIPSGKTTIPTSCPANALQPLCRSSFAVLVVAAPPDACLVPPFWCAVEPLVHSPEAVHSARIDGIGVVDDVVVEHECAHARCLSRWYVAASVPHMAANLSSAAWPPPS